MPNRRIRRKHEKEELARVLAASRKVLAEHREAFEALAELERTPVPSWLRVLGPIPADARVELRPFVPEGVRAGDQGGDSVFAGWTQRVVILASGQLGVRALIAGTDAEGRLVMASDTVVRGPFSAEGPSRAAGPPIHRTTSIGGRFEPDGEFRGTRWQGSESRPPAESEVAALRALLDELLQRSVSE